MQSIFAYKFIILQLKSRIVLTLFYFMIALNSVLGPTLFLLFINDVTDIFEGLSVTCKIYADDIKLYTSYSLNQLHNDLEVATKRLISWAVTWQLELAADKCTVCRIENSHWQTTWDHQ